MKQHDSISLLKHPVIFFKDKADTFLNQKKAYAIASIPSVLAILSFIADITGILQLDKSQLTILLVVFFFIYGIINLVLVTTIQRSNVRLNKQKSTAEIMHKVVAENIREYLTYKRLKIEQRESLSEKEIKDYIFRLLRNFCDQYLSVYYRKGVTVTLKYHRHGKLRPLRYGIHSDSRSKEPEFKKDSYVYNALNNTRKKLSYIYVKDVLDMDERERDMVSGYESNIMKRAMGTYRTFIALPVRTGRLESTQGSSLIMKQDLGIIGLDLPTPYGFGNFEENEIHILLCLADLISEPVNDLINLN